MLKRTEEEFREYSTSGNLLNVLLEVGLPLALFSLFNSVFNILDMMMASHVSTVAVSAVAYMAQLQMIVHTVAQGVIAGSMVKINRSFGMQKYEETKHYTNQLILLLTLLSLIVLLSIPFMPAILRLIRTPEEFIDEGFKYFSLLLVATCVNFYNQLFVSIEKTRGNTRKIMVLNILSMVLKLGLTAIFIYGMDADIIMIAVASLLSYLFIFCFAIFCITDKKSHFSIDPSLLKFDKHKIGRLINISYPLAIEKASFSMGKALVNSMIIYYGSAMVGALGISNNLTGISNNFQGGFSDSESAIISQNIGAGRYDRAIKAYFLTTIIVTIANLIISLLLLLFSSPLIHIFATARGGVDREFEMMIKSVFLYDLIGGVLLVINSSNVGFLVGIGKTKLALFNGLCRMFLFRIPVLMLLERFTNLGSEIPGVMMMISHILSGLLSSLLVAYEIIQLRKKHLA
ncbi:MAG: hypothetical protein K6G51_01950 [Sphaerochaetaceae bacterium]|nr:hypothetical protein [Sphaerochaetaceae bacterium]